ncbi:Arylsulfatase precursor [Planctomycetes bacterium CA13]|uniref:Arylsulfatase n=1 Tax=Novipirellula herctigrandis TaxID=2527986 RepID=A0A5C5Z054_9BACT|nr:Arylsulfatase precursor [Planctomycetes bacterium CA13]
MKTKLMRMFILACCMPLASTALADASPNIVLILTDDQGWSQRSGAMRPDVSDSYSDYLWTPNMDRIAAEGMRFTSGYSPAPLCTPTRRSILCGSSAARSGTEFKSSWVPSDHMTIPKAMKLANPAYRCAHFGKWGELMISSPEECGYDVSDGHTGNVTGGMEDKMQPFHIAEDPKRTGSVTDRAVQFMTEQVDAGQPFYAQVSYYAVHLRIELLEATLKKYQQKGAPDRAYPHGWAGMLEELDAGIGNLLNALDELGVSENTYVVFMSDNGGRGTVPGGNSKSLPPNAPLSGAKHSLLEGGIRVPFMVRGPSIQPGSICRVPVVGYDLLPTFYALAGGKDTLGNEIDGGNIASLFANPKVAAVDRPLDALIFHRPNRGMSAARQGEFKLFAKVNPQGKIKSSQLFNVELDYKEEQDLSGEMPELADRLKSLLTDFVAKVVVDEPVKEKLNRKKKRQP